MRNSGLVQDWLEGWNGRDLDLLMSHYADEAVFVSPSLLILAPGANGIVRGKDNIRRLYRQSLDRFPKLRFEIEDVVERDYGVIVFYRKLGVFVDDPGLTVEVFHVSGGKIVRNVVYWGYEEVAGRLRPA